MDKSVKLCEAELCKAELFKAMDDSVKLCKAELCNAMDGSVKLCKAAATYCIGKGQLQPLVTHFVDPPISIHP